MATHLFQIVSLLSDPPRPVMLHPDACFVRGATWFDCREAVRRYYRVGNREAIQLVLHEANGNELPLPKGWCLLENGKMRTPEDRAKEAKKR